MIRTTFAVLALAAVISAGSAKAQTYDPNYPICMRVVEALGGERMDCMFTSIGQCVATASGRAATCLVNPYFGRMSGRPRH